MSSATVTQPGGGGWRRRILVVENDPTTLADHMRNLRTWDYQVFAAQGQAEALIDDAKRLAREQRCHLALVDMRLLDDNDASDESGLQLIKSLTPLPAFVVSGYGSLQKAGQAIRESGAIEFIGKEEGPRRLRDAISKFFQDHCGRSLYRGEIVWARGYEPDKIIEELFEPETLVHPDEIECVTRRLFSDPPFTEKQILRFATIAGATRSVRTHSLRHSAVFKVSADELEPVFVKFALAQQVEVEYDNYMRYIKNQLPGSRHSELEQRATVGFAGGVRYGFLGADIRDLTTLADRLHDMTAQQVNQCLATFFQEIWASKYHQRQLSRASLFRTYASIWSEKWIERLRTFPIGAAHMAFAITAASRLQLPNPVAWLCRRTDLAHDSANDITATLTHYTAITHGDLHTRNIFVDKHYEPWIIDYERTGDGPILRDFVEMEIDLLLYHLDSNNWDDTALLRLFTALLKPKSLGSHIPLEQLAPNLVRFCTIANNLRSLARSVAEVRDAQEYYWGLLFDITLVLSHIEGKMRRFENSPFQRNHTIEPDTTAVDEIKRLNRNLWSLLLLGAIICFRLDHWDKPWPPKLWYSDVFE